MGRRRFDLSELVLGERAPQQAPREEIKIRAQGERKEASIWRVSIGLDKQGRIITIPLFENRVLICGSSGSGKSIMSNQILSEVFSIPQELRITALVDLKGGLEIQAWANIADATARTPEYANRIIGNVYREMKRREEEVRRAQLKKIRISPSRPLIVLYIDELAEIASKSKDKDTAQINAETMDYLSRIFRLGRATGIVPIVALQRPDSAYLGELKNNIQTTICGRVRSQVDTQTVFGADKVKTLPAHTLSGYWFYLVDDKREVKVKTPYVKGPQDLDPHWRQVISDCEGKYDEIKDRGKFLYSSLDHPSSSSVSPPSEKTDAKNETKKETKRRRGRPKKNQV